MDWKKHHTLQYIVLPAVLVGSDMFIGMQGHYVGSVDNVFSWENFVSYISTTSNQLELCMVAAIAVVILFLVEVIIKMRIENNVGHLAKKSKGGRKKSTQETGIRIL